MTYVKACFFTIVFEPLEPLNPLEPFEPLKPLKPLESLESLKPFNPLDLRPSTFALNPLKRNLSIYKYGKAKRKQHHGYTDNMRATVHYIHIHIPVFLSGRCACYGTARTVRRQDAL